MTSTQRTSERSKRSVAGFVAVSYGAGAYLAFLVVSVYAVAFLADVVVPRTVDRGGPHASTPTALVVDSLLLGLFAAQHSVMARPGFKRRWTGLVPSHVERATYVLVASAVLALLYWQWRPVPTVVWDVDAPAVRALIWAMYALGW